MTFFDPVPVLAGQRPEGIASPRPARLVRRDRRGRGLRGPQLPGSLPGARTRHEQFSDHLAAAVGRLAEVAGAAETAQPSGSAVERAQFRVSMVPEDLEHRLGLALAWGFGTLEDPLGTARRQPDGTVLITLHRKPIEARCPAPALLPELIYGALLEQWAEVTGLSPEAVDPDHRW